MKKLAFMFVAALSAVLNAADSQPKSEKPPLTAAEKAARHERMMVKTGGIVEKVGDGKIVFINCQSRIGDEEIKQRVDRMRFLLKFNMEIRTGSWQIDVKKPDDATVAIYIIDDEKLPLSLVAVESRWGAVNTSQLKLGTRFSKELSRVVTMVLGGDRSQFPASPMQTVCSASDLDKLLTDNFAMDSVTQIQLNTKALGMSRNGKTSYLKACEEGWAHAPTNRYEKAIWDKVHSEKERGPVNGLKILPPKK